MPLQTILFYISIALFVIAALCAAGAVYVFFAKHVMDVRADLSGKKRAKAIEENRGKRQTRRGRKGGPSGASGKNSPESPKTDGQVEGIRQVDNALSASEQADASQQDQATWQIGEPGESPTAVLHESNAATTILADGAAATAILGGDSAATTLLEGNDDITEVLITEGESATATTGEGISADADESVDVDATIRMPFITEDVIAQYGGGAEQDNQEPAEASPIDSSADDAVTTETSPSEGFEVVQKVFLTDSAQYVDIDQS